MTTGYVDLVHEPPAASRVIALLGELAERRHASVPRVIRDALAAYGISPFRWTGVWFETLSDEALLEALTLLETTDG